MSFMSGLKHIFNHVCGRDAPSAGTQQQFHIADILSVSTQKYLSNPETSGFSHLKGHITQHVSGKDKKLGVGLDEYSEALSKFMKKELPFLKDIKFPDLPAGLSREASQEIVQKFVQEVAAKHGEYHQVGQMKPSRPRTAALFTSGRSGPLTR